MHFGDNNRHDGTGGIASPVSARHAAGGPGPEGEGFSDKPDYVLFAFGAAFAIVLIAFLALVLFTQPDPSGIASADDEDKILFESINDTKAEISPLKAIDEECYLDRDRQLHLTCQVVASNPDADVVPPVSGAEVGYALYGAEGDRPYSFIGAFANEGGYINVTVDFPGLHPDIDEAHVLGGVDDLVSYDVSSVGDSKCDYGPQEHAGELEFARGNWIDNESWYIVDYRSWGSRAAAARNTGASPDPAVRERYTWYTSPQTGKDVNADGTANYWDDRNWILVHDYSWMAKIWLTMSPGAVYFIDGVEYQAEGVFNIDRDNPTRAVYDITGEDSLIIQTCDGRVFVRIIYGYPVGQERPKQDAAPSGGDGGDGHEEGSLDAIEADSAR